MFGRNFVGGCGCLQKNAVKVKMANIMLSWSECFHAALSFAGRVSEVHTSIMCCTYLLSVSYEIIFNNSFFVLLKY